MAFAAAAITSLDLTGATSLLTIGGQAFASCASLGGTLTIPASVTSIGNSAFDNCISLDASPVIFLGDAPTFGTNIWANTSVIEGTYYTGTTGWVPPPTNLNLTMAVINAPWNAYKKRFGMGLTVHDYAPDTPANGDMWLDGVTVKIHSNGVTVSL